MKILVFALVLSGAIDRGSLDIGLDVLPEAFSFAAHRVGFMPSLRLSKCTRTECLWEIGNGVEMSAAHIDDGIAITRIEAKLRPTRPIAPEVMRQFENACLAIVALVDRDGDPVQQRATAKAIVISTGAEPRVERDLPERNVRFYGTRSAAMVQDKPNIVLRCGAAATS